MQWIAAYLRDPERYPVLSRVGQARSRRSCLRIRPKRPKRWTPFSPTSTRILMPGMTHWNHPGFMAYFANSSPAPGIAAEALAAALNQNAMLWRTSPAATELEEVVLDWLAQMLGLPAGQRGLITDTASISSLLALCAAREAIPGLNIREQGMAGRADVPCLRLYCSEQAHSSIERAAMTLGIGQQGVRKIPTDSQFRMDVGALRQALEEDTGKETEREVGTEDPPNAEDPTPYTLHPTPSLQGAWHPFCVVATAGTTSTTAIDPVRGIAALCRRVQLLAPCRCGIWRRGGSRSRISSYAGWLRRGRHDSRQSTQMAVHAGGLFRIVRPRHERPAPRVQFGTRLPGDGGEVTNFMDYGVQFGRRFRALKFG